MDIRNIEQHEEDKLIANLEREYKDEIYAIESKMIKEGKTFYTESIGGYQFIAIKPYGEQVKHIFLNTIKYIEEVTR